MITIMTSGWEAYGLTSTGGVVSPSSRKKKLSCILTVMDSKVKHYGKKTTYL